MEESGKRVLSHYVKAVMKQKGLTQRDVEVRSGGKITDGYVAGILNGTAKNPSAEKIKALARGLGVDAHELFDVVCGPFEETGGEQQNVGRLQIVSFLEMMREIVENPDLMKLLEEAIKLWPEERSIIFQSMEAFNQRKRKATRGKKPTGGQEGI